MEKAEALKTIELRLSNLKRMLQGPTEYDKTWKLDDRSNPVTVDKSKIEAEIDRLEDAYRKVKFGKKK